MFSFSSIIPLLSQALLSRGITELLLTSDNKEGLKRGGVKGGIVRWADRQTRLCIHTHPNKHTYTVWWVGVLSHDDKRSEPKSGLVSGSCSSELHTKDSVLSQKSCSFCKNTGINTVMLQYKSVFYHTYSMLF